MLTPFQPVIAVTLGTRGLLRPFMILAGVASLLLRCRVVEARVRQRIIRNLQDAKER